MTTTMRRALRTTAMTCSAIALTLGATGCGGLLPGGDAEPAEEQGQEQAQEEQAEDTAEDDAAAEEDAAEEDDQPEVRVDDEGHVDVDDESADEDSSDEDAADDAASGDIPQSAEDVTDEDLEAAKERVIGFLQASATGDGEAACSYVADPSTGEPVTGDVLDGCAKDFEEAAANSEDSLEEGMFDALDPSMIETEAAEDGRIDVTVIGQPLNAPLLKASDGEWYVDASDML